jgi:hypothetical protein
MPRYRDWDRDLDDTYTRVRVKKTNPGRRSHNSFDDDDRNDRDFYRQGPRKNNNNDINRRQSRD